MQHHLGHKSASITLDRYEHLFPRSWTTWPIGWTAYTREAAVYPACTDAAIAASGKAKGLVGDQALVVEVGRLELRCAPLLHPRSGGCRPSDLRFG